ncbi:hypothetical protein [Pseudarthrobacter sp. NS4]|uniref:hypothetical protein n=1 Tax=Pseudarthrobacter sp. NS4 TaxID=2973976 RepID=UPI002162A3B3|nr:hypothetical protein [Pseudarthrobacter sp. NS4]
MGFEPHEPEQRSQLKDALDAADITVGELWLRYFSMTGSAGEYEVRAYLQGLISLPVTQRDLLAMACNEIIGETPPLYAPFADQMYGAGTGSDGGGSEDRRQRRDGAG